MKHFLLCAAALFVLQSCGEKPTGEDMQAAAPVALSPRAEIGGFGVDTASIDASVSPGDDFYAYVNGVWLSEFEIPDEYSSYGTFTMLAERSEDRLRAIIEEAEATRSASGSVEQQIGDYYASFVDVDTINAKRLEPLRDDLARIAGLSTTDDVVAAFADPMLPAASPIAAFIGVDAKFPDRYAIYLTQSGLGMPNRDYYLEERFADKQARYLEFIEQTLTLAGVDDAQRKASSVYALERRIAEAHWDAAKRRNRDLTYNPKSLDELAAFAPSMPWPTMMKAAGLGGRNRFIVREDDALRQLAQITAATPIDVWKDYLVFHLLRANAEILPEAFDDASFAFYGTQLRGALKKRDRWKRGVEAIDNSLGEAVGKIYVERYFPADAKAKAETIVDNLRKALGERIENSPWMSDETRSAAMEKLSKFTPKIGYPEKWRLYDGLLVVRGDAYGNAKRAQAFEWNYEVARLDQPVDKAEWGMTPQTVNAYYSSTRNEIVFPAAILQPPFFDPNADLAVNYGAIGAVIGHEIGHGFDDQGRKSDGDGVLRDWWTRDDAERFEVLAGRIGAQYSAYEPLPGFAVNSDLTMGENIGDIGGVAMAYHAYKLALGGEDAPVIEGFTGDQRFFLSWAQIWKRIVRDDSLKNQIANDPHAPAQFRVNGVVRNMDAWYSAFDVTEEHALYLAPADRVEIW